MIIKLTKATRVLMPAGSAVEVDSLTAEHLFSLGVATKAETEKKAAEPTEKPIKKVKSKG